MLSISAPIKNNDQGPPVRNLQDGLLTLLKMHVISLPDGNGSDVEQALQEEQATQAYGAATETLLKTFQERNNLAASGYVDEPTAQALNAVLRWLEPRAHASKGLWMVSGRVQTAEGEAGAGLTVAAYHYHLSGATLLGSTLVDGNGFYSITYDDATFRNAEGVPPNPDLFVRAFDANGQLLATSPTVPKAAPDVAIHVYIDSWPRVVHGGVTDSAGLPLAGLTVRAEDCDMLDTQQRLGQAKTDAKGLYRIVYAPVQIAKAEIGGADLRVSVLDDKGVEIAASDVVFNAPADQVIDIKVAREAFRGPSEHQRNRARVLRLAQQLPLGQLTDKHLAFAERESGIPLAHLHFLRLDEQWANARGLEQGIFYGLFRQGLPNNAGQLLAQAPARLRRALEDAATTNIIAPFGPGRLDQIMQRLHDEALDEAFKYPQDTSSPAPLGAVLASAPVAAQVQQRVVDFALSYQGEGDVWSALAARAELNPDELHAVRFALEANQLVFNHLPTLRAVQQLRQERALTGATASLASLSAQDWQRIVTDSTAAGMPSGFQDGAAFAKAIEHRIEQNFPTAVFARRLAGTNDRADSEVAQFLSTNRSFDLLRTPVDTFFDNGANWGQVRDRAALRNKVKAISRVTRCVPDLPDQSRFDLTQALLANGYDSAHKIATADQGTFAGRLAPTAGVAATTQLIATARARVDATNFHFLNLRDFADQPAAFLPRARTATGKTPNWAGIFGTLANCECKHCRSVYSPAAYMVDLLQFLRGVCLSRAGNGDCTRSLRDVLFTRRPGIAHLLLNCVNATTSLPYIDLVNETLEDAVASTGPDGRFIAPAAIGVPPPNAAAEQLALYEQQIARYQTSSHEAAGRTQAAHEAALRAQPEPRASAATAMLAAAVFPWTLPFSAAHEQVWMLADHLDLPLAEVIELFSTVHGTDEPTRDWITRAGLHMTPSEWNLLVGTPVADQRHLWGGADAPALAAMPAFLERSGLSYSEVEELAESWFFSGARRLRIEPGADPCDIDTYHLRGLDSEGMLDRLHRFLRLRRKLGWSIGALDNMLAALGHDAIDALVIFEATQLRKVASLLTLSVDDTATLLRLPHDSDDEPVSRTGAWAHALRLRTDELTQLVHLAGVPILESSQSALADVQSLVELRRAAEQSGLSIAELAYLLLHKDQAPPAFAPREADLHTFLIGLRRLVAETSAQKLRLAEEEILRTVRAFEQGEPRPPAEAVEALRRDLVADHNLRIANEIAAAVSANLAAYVGLGDDLTAILIAPSSAPDGSVSAPLILGVSDPARSTPALADFLAFVRMPDGAPGSDPGTSAEFGHARHLLIRLLKSARLIASLGLGTGDLDAIRAVGAANDFLDFNEIPFELHDGRPDDRARLSRRWLALASAVALRGALPRADHNLFDFIRHPALSEASPEALADPATYAYLSEHTGWPAQDLAALQERFDFHGEDFIRVDTYRRLATATAWLRRWELTPAMLVSLSSPVDLAGDEAPLLTTLMALGRSKHDNETAWFKVLTPLMDTVREKKRDALLAYLLHHRLRDDADQRRFADANEVYAYYLIDVEMSACQLTSRIVQANGAIQLFVQRCRMNLERPEISLSESADSQPWNQWDWMKNYRVWEANRKVFLYPENWIEPDLRDNKSPFFAEMESQLLQDQVNPETVERAYRSYLEKLHQVGMLKVCTLFEEVTSNGKIIHFLARGSGSSPVYFYRQRRADRSWTPWEDIGLSIDSDQLVLFQEAGRTRLVWVTLKHQTIEEETPSVHVTLPLLPEREPEFGIRYKSRHEIQINWATRTSAGWGSPKTMKAPSIASIEMRLINLSFRLRSEDFHLRLRSDVGVPSRIVLFTDVAMFGDQREELWGGAGIALAEFEIDTCTDAMRLMTVMERMIFNPPWSEPEQNDLKVGHGLSRSPIKPYRSEWWSDYQISADEYARAFSRVGGVWTSADVPTWNDFDHLFASTESPTRESMVAPSDAVPLNAWKSFVFAPGNHAFLVEPEEIRRPSPDPDQDADGSWMTPWNFADALRSVLTTEAPRPRGYRFSLLYHPFVCELIVALERGGIAGLLAPAYTSALFRQARNQLQTLGNSARIDLLFGNLTSEPVAGGMQKVDHIDGFEFGTEDANGLYNWELFFHAPLLIADRLSKEQRFEEAQRWFHYIFNPTDRSRAPASARVWQVKPLYDEARRWGALPETLEQMLVRLSAGANDVQRQVAAWRENPFNPHLIARLRLLAYMKTVVMKYMDNLIAWGDYLFSNDTMESVNEATQIYVLAAALLGERPSTLSREEQAARTYSQVDAALDHFSNALIAMETGLPPLDLTGPLAHGDPIPPNLVLYFCIPANEKLLGYWDTVADRLFKVRHCMDIEGRVRQLPLFAPPIDPALLVRARAAGLNLQDVLNTQTRLPHHRFQLLAQKAQEFCADVRGLGNLLLSTLEKKDAEQLTLLRSRHEVALLNRMSQLKQLQFDETEQALEAIAAARPLAEARQTFYSIKAAEFNSAREKGQIANLHEAQMNTILAKALGTAAAIGHASPDFLGPVAKWGGSHVGHALEAAAGAVDIFATQYAFDASMDAISAGYERRRDDWLLQADLASKELDQIDKQVLAAQIRCQVAEKDLSTLELQIEQARESKLFLEGKFTSAQLFGWMAGQVSALYYQAYKMAHELARTAERAAEYELGLEAGELAIIQAGSIHWDSLRKGLPAGERLHQDLRRLELAYMERNVRMLEMSKHVSLRQLDPLSLMRLRVYGICEFTLPKVLFDLDFPGHMQRRIKSVSVSVPCVLGPYTSVSGTLTLLAHWGDTSDIPAPAIPVSSIATSTAQNDDGLFDLNFRDERFLPFEGAGIVSNWRFSLPQAFRAFDYDTIADVIVHVNYTARDNPATSATTSAAIAAVLADLQALGPRQLLISVKHDFPAQWWQLQSDASAEATRAITIGPALFPFFVRRRINITRVQELSARAETGSDISFAVGAGAQPPSISVNVTRAHQYLLVSYVFVEERPATPDAPT